MKRVKHIVFLTENFKPFFFVKVGDSWGEFQKREFQYKICSFDIEASSSHGDFPVPIKDYKKLGNKYY